MYEPTKVYLAGPFFKPEQAQVIRDIEDLLDSEGIKYFSPREYGVISDTPMTPERTKRIFDMNIRMLLECNTLIAVTDDFDPGTMFEIGSFYSDKVGDTTTGDADDCTPIITYSPAGYGSNVMIALVTFTHARNMEELELAIRGHKVSDQEVTE